MSLPGVRHKYNNIELKRPVQERYIQSIHSELCDDGGDQIEVIVTMLPMLAQLVHEVTSTQHDTTYKRVFGSFNEWEIVVWDPRLCRREFSSFTIIYFIQCLCLYRCSDWTCLLQS